MTTLEEFKEATRKSIVTRENRLLEWDDISQEQKRDFRDVLLDILSDTPTNYKLTVAQTESIQDIDQIAKLWLWAHESYSKMLHVWENAPIRLREDELFAYWGSTIKKLQQVTLEHYEFHALK